MKKILTRRILKNDFNADMHPVLQRVYAARGVSTTAELERDLKNLLPFQELKGISEAAKYLADAVIQNKKILIIGDFDTDGATSTTLAVNALQSFGAQFVNYLVPNRFEYGYGLSPEIVAVAAKRAPNVIITVDNGIASHAGVDAANTLGIDVIITDHHLPAETLPQAKAIVNPQQKGDTFRSKNLAGVGVIFYVMLALRSELRERNWFALQNISEPNMANFLDLVALGTVADLVPLDHNNRILVHQGILRIRAGKACPGIQALLTISGRQSAQLAASDLGFAVGPRLNAAGRLADMTLGIECLLSKDLNNAREMATQLSLLNEERRQIEREMQTQAFTELNKLQNLETKKDLPVGLCLFDENWHQGVIGLLASKVKDFLYRPTIVFAPGNTAEELKGSARSISSLHVRDTLDAIATRHPGLICKFGGHAMAAGLSLKRVHLAEFTQAFNEEVKRRIDASDLQNMLYTDGMLLSNEFSLSLAEQIQAAGPWGQTFPEPLFDGEFKLLQQRIVGDRHLKLTLTPHDSSLVLDAIAFNINIKEWPNHRAERVQAAYRLDVNEYLGRKNLQLIIEQLEPL